jgi:hypothetical protein
MLACEERALRNFSQRPCMPLCFMFASYTHNSARIHLFDKIHSSRKKRDEMMKRWAKMGNVLLISQTTHRNREQKEVSVLKRTSNKIRGRLNGFLCSYATRNAIMVRIHTTTLLKRWAEMGRVQLDSEKLAAKVGGERITKKKLKEYVRTNIVVSPKKPSDRRYDAQLIPMLSCGEKCYYAC